MVSQGDLDDGGGQLARLPIHLHGDGFVRSQRDLPALVQPLTMAAHLKCGLWRSKSSMGYKAVSAQTHCTEDSNMLATELLAPADANTVKLNLKSHTVAIHDKLMGLI